MTVSAELLLQHIPSHQVGWCYWAVEQAVKPAPMTQEELGEFYQPNDWDGYDNGFKQEYPPSGLEGLRAAQAQGREVYLSLPGSLIDEESPEEQEKHRKWGRVREEIPFLMEAEECWDRERAYSWTVISLKAQLTQSQFDRLVRLIKEELG